MTNSITNRSTGAKKINLFLLSVLLLALFLTSLWFWNNKGNISSDQAQKIATDEATNLCLRTQFKKADCEGLSVRQTASRYTARDGRPVDGYYFEVSARNFSAIVVLDAQGRSIRPTPLPVD